MDNKFYVRTIWRDDNERFDFDGSNIYLAADNSLLPSPEIESSEIQYTDVDGGEMLHQRLQIGDMLLNGVMFPRNSGYWDLYTEIRTFFKINHWYRIVYRNAAGELFAQRGAWLSQNLQLPVQPHEDHAKWSIGFKLQSSALYEYAEDDEGNEIYANTVTIPLLTANAGGQKWNTVGQEWDTNGQVWLAGGGLQTISVASTNLVYPVWTVVGSATNPSLQNSTTDSIAVYNGTVESGQTLIVDFAAQRATLDGTVVTRYVSGLVGFDPGDNLVGFNIDSGSATSSTIAWNNEIG